MWRFHSKRFLLTFLEQAVAGDDLTRHKLDIPPRRNWRRSAGRESASLFKTRRHHILTARSECAGAGPADNRVRRNPGLSFMKSH